MSFDAVIHFIATVIYPGVLVVLLFGMTILIHELGHYLVARWRGMVVERFSIGFGPRLWGYTKNGIDYRISLLPFGGYVALPQMSPMEAIEGGTEASAESLPPASPASKILVALAGPVMNILFAIVLACIVWQVGLALPVNPSIIGWVEPNSREEQLGIQAGDRLVQVNDRPVQTWMDVQRAVAVSREPSVNVAIVHSGQRKEFLLETDLNPTFGMKTINLYPQGRPFAMDILPDSPAQKAGIQRGDKFMSVEGVPITTEQELRELIGKQAEKPTVVKVMRNDAIVTINVVPRLDEREKVGRMGVALADELDYETVKPGPTPLKQFRDILGLMGDTVYALIHSKQTGLGARSLSGPVGIAGGWWYEIVHGGITRGLWYAVLLNLNLALLNLLPLPLLDGGHIVLSVVEAVFRKPLNARLQHVTATTFAFVLIGFMLYVTFFDIERLTFGWFRHGSGSTTNQPASTPVLPQQ